jgi:HAD superfamily hydrolase (TIGR01490 family)
MKQRKFAAFDIDGTIGRTSIFFQVVDELIKRKHLPSSARKLLDEKFESYRRRIHKQAFSDYSKLSVKILFENLKGVKVTDYQKAVDAVLKPIKSYSYVYTRDLIKQLKTKGYFLIALSGSEMYAVKQFADHYGFDVAIGEIYVEKGGYFTGKVEEVYHRKDYFLKQLIAEHDLTLKDSIAVGDSYGDIRMLAAVEKPVAFNPEEQLYSHARKHGWEIVVERKNVIYELTKNGQHYQLS